MSGPITRVPVSPRQVVCPEGAGLTHVGRVRAVNEDRVLGDPASRLWAIADGMGGHGHGDIAAEAVIAHLAGLPPAADPAALAAALVAANADILMRARGEGIGPMGATVVAALIDAGAVTVAWAGDSRGYLLRAGALRPLTHDHSVVQEMIDGGQLAPDEAEGHPQAHVVTRAIGTAERVEIALAGAALLPDDVLLLCSDGLTKCLAEPEIVQALGTAADPEAACRRLIEAVLARGAPDNVSVIVVRPGGAA